MIKKSMFCNEYSREEIQKTIKRYPRIVGQVQKYIDDFLRDESAAKVILARKQKRESCIIAENIDYEGDGWFPYTVDVMKTLTKAIENRPRMTSSLRMNEQRLKRTNRAIVFDSTEWRGKDVGDNSCFYHAATVIGRRFTHEDRLWLVDVVFDHDGRESRGHFEYGVKYIREEARAG